MIAEITGLPPYLLSGSRPKLSDFPAIIRLSWLSGRETTRPEDFAYCMLGILEINMPLLYGEGRAKAMERLQLEVLRHSGDESLFCLQGLDAQDPQGIDLLTSNIGQHQVLTDVVRMGVHDRPPLVISSNCIEMRMPRGRGRVFFHRKHQSSYAVLLNCISMAKHTARSPCVMFVESAGCRPDHFIRVPGSTRCRATRTKDLYTEDDIAEPEDWKPRKTDETMYIHLRAEDCITCRADPGAPNDIAFRLKRSH